MIVKGEPRHWDPESAPSFWINHASRLLLRHFERTLRPLDFGWAYVRVVMALQGNDGLQQRELAEQAQVEQPTMAALLMRMERDNLITRKPHPTDKRASTFSLTAKAKARIPEAKELLGQVADRLTAGFSVEERKTLLGLLRRAVSNLDAPVDEW